MDYKIKEFKLLSSLEKVFYDFPYSTEEYSCGEMFKNEIYSFQLCGIVESVSKWGKEFTLRIETESKLSPFITAYTLGFVPSTLPCYMADYDKESYLTKTPCFIPDTLNRVYDNSFTVKNGLAFCVWFEVQPNCKIAGTHEIKINVRDSDGELMAQKTFTLEIIDAELPKQTLINTGWLHGDCIAALHNTEVGSEEYWNILCKYLSVYVKFGHNMILTPLFTPPLDTAVGEQRPTNQLVKVELCSGVYSFDFSLLEKWIDLCHVYGIEYFEMSHLFTQWGAKATPKIMASVDGVQKRIFGWDVEALSSEYTRFLDAFLPELRAFLEAKGVYKSCYFHVSDEPSLNMAEQYQKVSLLVTKHIDKQRTMDAISDYEFYEKGLISRPVVANDHIKSFVENNVPNLWTYYCCAQGKDASNRFMAMPPYRNRILGLQLYKYNIQGFLQWGFNFWFSQFSKEVIDPYKVTDAKGAFPSGDAFVVYPLDGMGNVVLSSRLFVFNEALQDMRALQLLQKLTDRDSVLQLLGDICEFCVYPRNSEYILKLRSKVNKRIKELI